MHVLARVTKTAIVLLLPLTFGACEWFTDFKRQPAIEPWESPSQNPNDTTTPPRGNPQYSVPIQGTMSSGIEYSYARMPQTVDSMSGLTNPHPASPASLENGRRYFQIYCAVCHGMAGAGGATGNIARVNPNYGFSPSLLAASAMGRSDGYIYGMIRNGRGLMPSYNRIEENERWDVVNYVRALQAKTADTTLAGYPGQNGTTVPGPSFTAPTRPAPYVHANAVQTPGSSGINSATYRGRNDGPREGSVDDAQGNAAVKKAAGEAAAKSGPPANKEKH